MNKNKPDLSQYSKATQEIWEKMDKTARQIKCLTVGTGAAIILALLIRAGRFDFLLTFF